MNPDQAIADTDALVAAYLRERGGLVRQLELNKTLSDPGRKELTGRVASIDKTLAELGAPVEKVATPAPETAPPKMRTTKGQE